MADNTNETQDAPLTGAALNLALAFKQGWRLDKIGARYIITAPDGKQEAYQKKAWAEARILKQCPDWANDTGAALALCLDVAKRISKEIEITLYGDGSYSICVLRTGQCEPEGVPAPNIATDLARLALAALEARE